MSPIYLHWWKGVPACPCAVCTLQSILQQKWFGVQSIAKMVGVTFNEQIQECLSTLHLCWPLFSHSYNSPWGAKKDMALGRGPWKESLNRYPRWDTPPHFLSLLFVSISLVLCMPNGANASWGTREKAFWQFLSLSTMRRNAVVSEVALCFIVASMG